MPGATKALISNDDAYVSPYLMRPLRRLDEVERSNPDDDADAKPAANDSKPQRRQGAGSRSMSADAPGRR